MIFFISVYTSSGKLILGGIILKLREIMTGPVIRIRPEEPVAVAARLLQRYNIGLLPVCASDGLLRGVVTDRDLVTRCLAANRSPASTTVGEVMTKNLITAVPEMDAAAAASLMGRRQVRRLPVLENGRLCGIVSLGDLANREETEVDASDALTEISSSLSKRE